MTDFRVIDGSLESNKGAASKLGSKFGVIADPGSAERAGLFKIVGVETPEKRYLPDTVGGAQFIEPADLTQESAGKAAANAETLSVARRRISELQLEHRALDTMINAVRGDNSINELHLRRLKKRKLQIKDCVVALQMQTEPDILA